MVTLKMSRQAAQNLFTLMIYAVPPTSAVWQSLAPLFDAMSESDEFSFSSPFSDANMEGFAQIKDWKPVSLESEDIVICELSND